MIDAQVYLASIRAMGIRLQTKIQQVQRLRDSLQSITASLDQEFVSHTKSVGAMADTIAMMIDIEKEVDQQTSEYLKAKREALRLLERIKPESATILVERYFEGKTFIEIGKIIFVTERQAQRRCKEAIREFQRVLDEKGSSQ